MTVPSGQVEQQRGESLLAGCHRTDTENRIRVVPSMRDDAPISVTCSQVSVEE